MSFKPAGVSLPQQFSRTGGTKQYDRDRLVEVISFNLGNASIRVREVSSGRLMDVTIHAESIASGNEREARPGTKPREAGQKDWVGWKINQNMAADLKPGSRLVLERCQTTRRVASREGDQEVSSVVARYIRNASQAKAMQVPFSITAYEGRVQNVYTWEPIAINPETPEGEAQVMDLAAKLNAAREAYLFNKEQSSKENKEYRPYTAYGVKLRCIAPGEPDREGKPTYVTVDTVEAFDWAEAQKDSAGTVIRPGAPVSGEQFLGILQDYIGYITGSSGEAPALEAKGFNTADLKIEVMAYKKFPVSDKSRTMSVEGPGGKRLKSLTETPSRLSLTDLSQVESSRNWAVDGIVLLTADKADSATRTFIERNIVNSIFVNGFSGSVQDMVKSADGAKVNLHKDLRIERPKQDASADAPAAGYSAPASQGQGNPGPGSAGLPAANLADEQDPFAVSAPAASTPAPAPAAAPTPAPAAPVAAPAPATPAPAAAAPGPSRFGRRN